MASTNLPYRALVIGAEKLGSYLGGLTRIPEVKVGHHSTTYLANPPSGPVIVLADQRQGRGRFTLAVNLIRDYTRKTFNKDTPIIFVGDYLGEKLGDFIRYELDAFWIDLSGNGYVNIPEIHIDDHSTPNKYPMDRDRDNPTTPHKTRMLRTLLMNYDSLNMLELAKIAEVDHGAVSRTMNTLARRGLVETPGKHSRNKLYCPQPLKLLDYWRKRHYLSTRKEILPGRVTTMNVGHITETLKWEGYKPVWTMMTAAWLYTKFGDYDHETVYLDRDPDIEIAEILDIDIESKDPNLFIILNSRPDTFDLVVEIDNIPIVDPFRCYVDLKYCTDPLEPTATQRMRDYIKYKFIHRK